MESTESMTSTLDIHEVEELVKNGRLLDKNNPTVVAVSGNMVVKEGFDIFRTEGLAMQFIRERTSISVPRPISYLSNPSTDGELLSRRAYLVMEMLRGVTLRSVLGHLQKPQKNAIIKDLRKVTTLLRRLDEPASWGMIGKGGAYHGGFFQHLYTAKPCRPCPPNSLRDIKDWFIGVLPQWQRIQFEAGGRLADRIQPTFVEHESVFSHGDLCPENILVNPMILRITGIIDWAGAGWYPRFWDHFVAIRTKLNYHTEEYSDWHYIYSRVFGLYPEEATGFNLLVQNALLTVSNNTSVGL